MTIYVLSYGYRPSDQPVVTACRNADEAAAEAAVQRAVPRSTFTIATDSDVPFGGAGLVEVYNALSLTAQDWSAQPVKRFESRRHGIERLMAIFPIVATHYSNTRRAGSTAGNEETMENTNTDHEPEKKRRPPAKVGDAMPIREGGTTHKVFVAAAGGGKTFEQIAAEAGTHTANATAIVKNVLRVNHGITHEVDDDGRVALVLPEGHTHETMVKERVGKRAAAPRAPSDSPRARLLAKVEDGQMPVKPVVTSETNKHRQKHFDQLAAWAEAGEWDQMVGYKSAGIDSYSKSIRAYRDALLAYHARAEEQQAAE